MDEPPRKRHRDEDYQRERQRDFPEPNRTLVFRGLSFATTEDDVRQALAKFTTPVSVRIARDRNTGESRGLAFVDMDTLQTAEEVMDSLGGYIFIQGAQARVEYSRDTSRQDPSAGPNAKQDWVCASCNTMNFARRNVCFTCSLPREGNELPLQQIPAINAAAMAEMIDKPSSILLLRGLAPQTTDYHIRIAMSQWPPRITEIRVIPDKNMCFVDYGNVLSSQAVYKYASQGLLIMGSSVSVSYARPKDVADAGIAATGIGQGNIAVEQAMAIGSGQAFPTPANVPAGFVFDESSGWYYHAQTNYYFDASTNIYYEPTAQKYFKFDFETQQYTEIEGHQGTWGQHSKVSTEKSAAQVAAEAAAAAQAAMEKLEKNKKKKGSGITGMKINVGADLNKWKSKQDHPNESEPPDESAAGGGWSDISGGLPKGDGGAGAAAAAAPSASTSSGEAATAAPSTGPGGNISAVLENGTGVCYICRRKFGSAEQLKKHEELSDMHRQKLAEHKKVEIEQIKKQVMAEQHAMEKKALRQEKARKYAELAREEKEKEENLREAVEAARHGNKPQDTLAESKGSDLLRKMGWKEGEGLGKSGTGTKDPVTVVMRAERAGLGSGGEVTLDHLVTEADSLAQANRKKAAARLAATTQEQDPSEWRASFQS